MTVKRRLLLLLVLAVALASAPSPQHSGPPLFKLPNRWVNQPP